MNVSFEMMKMFVVKHCNYCTALFFVMLYLNKYKFVYKHSGYCVIFTYLYSIPSVIHLHSTLLLGEGIICTIFSFNKLLQPPPAISGRFLHWNLYIFDRYKAVKRLFMATTWKSTPKWTKINLFEHFIPVEILVIRG